jgi:hypothetical protein
MPLLFSNFNQTEDSRIFFQNGKWKIENYSGLSFQPRANQSGIAKKANDIWRSAGI